MPNNFKADLLYKPTEPPFGVEDPSVVCFDWDHTISSNHFHNTMAKATTRDDHIRVSTELVNGDNVPNKDLLLERFRDILAKGDKLAITSYSKYPAVMFEKLEAIGLTSKELAQIAIVSGLPDQKDMPSLGKSEHMKRACESFGLDPKNTKVVLIDDSENNIRVARQDKSFKEVAAIHCPHNKTTHHLVELKAVMEGIDESRRADIIGRNKSGINQNQAAENVNPSLGAEVRGNSSHLTGKDKSPQQYGSAAELRAAFQEGELKRERPVLKRTDNVKQGLDVEVRGNTSHLTGKDKSPGQYGGGAELRGALEEAKRAWKDSGGAEHSGDKSMEVTGVHDGRGTMRNNRGGDKGGRA